MTTESSATIDIENAFMPTFFDKIPIAFERGDGVYVWDADGKRYLDFTSGWGVTCIGHAHPVIREALETQARKLIQNPNSGATYSPARARLLALMHEILPLGLNRVFFSNSGAEANDAVIKLARKASGRLDIISAHNSFHGRTTCALSATGQTIHRDCHRPLMSNHRFVPFNDVDALERVIGPETAAVILEPIQGEGGVNVPADGYLNAVSDLCARHGAFLIVDEIQTGFCRTGPMFAVTGAAFKVDFLTMAKGMGGGFPIGAFAVSEPISRRLEKGDHGGTYCGNPLGSAVAYAVIRYLLDHGVGEQVQRSGEQAMAVLQRWQHLYPEAIRSVRGKGLLLAVEFNDAQLVAQIKSRCLTQGVVLNVIKGNIIRLFPALTIKPSELDEGLGVLEGAIRATV